MKVIYMQETIVIMSHKDPQHTQQLIQSGTINNTHKDKPYLVIQHED
jgi:hypothetical protein